jgi:HTH-type transcriptional regulator/antitoxin HipB
MLARTARDIGLLIRDQRRRQGLGQRDLAARIGVSRQWVVEVEGGKPRAPLELVLRALSALGLEVSVTPATRVPARPPDSPKSLTDVDLDQVIERARAALPLPASSARSTEAPKRRRTNAQGGRSRHRRGR